MHYVPVSHQCEKPKNQMKKYDAANAIKKL